MGVTLINSDHGTTIEVTNEREDLCNGLSCCAPSVTKCDDLCKEGFAPCTTHDLSCDYEECFLKTKVSEEDDTNDPLDPSQPVDWDEFEKMVNAEIAERRSKWYYPLIKAKNYCTKIWNWVQDYTTRRYHMLDLRNAQYKHGWIDSDTVMLYSCFAALTRFVEEEEGLDSLFYQPIGLEKDIELYGDPDGELEKLRVERLHVAEEAKLLYNWWQGYQHNQGSLFDGSHKIETDNLIRLIKIRDYLWT